MEAYVNVHEMRAAGARVATLLRGARADSAGKSAVLAYRDEISRYDSMPPISAEREALLNSINRLNKEVYRTAPAFYRGVHDLRQLHRFLSMGEIKNDYSNGFASFSADAAVALRFASSAAGGRAVFEVDGDLFRARESKPVEYRPRTARLAHECEAEFRAGGPVPAWAVTVYTDFHSGEDEAAVKERLRRNCESINGHVTQAYASRLEDVRIRPISELEQEWKYL